MAFFSFIVSESTESTRLDKFLVSELPQYSREFLKKCQLKVNGEIMKPSQRVHSGDEIQVAVPALKDLKIEPENIPLTILYEDSEILVINKPAGMVMHPTDHGGHVTGTLVNAVLWYLRKSPQPLNPPFQGGQTAEGDQGGASSSFRPGIVHRLDRDTSGVIVVGKTDVAKASLTQQFAKRQVEKEYLALVTGNLKEDQGRIEAPLGRGATNRMRREVSSRADAREAITEFTVVERFTPSTHSTASGQARLGTGEATLVKVRILTGRTHQIRVHFLSIQHPIVGDTEYGYRRTNKKLDCPRQFLHAAKLTFQHPRTGEKVSFEAPLPGDLAKVLKRLE